MLFKNNIIKKFLGRPYRRIHELNDIQYRDILMNKKNQESRVHRNHFNEFHKEVFKFKQIQTNTLWKIQ